MLSFELRFKWTYKWFLLYFLDYYHSAVLTTITLIVIVGKFFLIIIAKIWVSIFRIFQFFVQVPFLLLLSFSFHCVHSLLMANAQLQITKWVISQNETILWITKLYYLISSFPSHNVKNRFQLSQRTWWSFGPIYTIAKA